MKIKTYSEQVAGQTPGGPAGPVGPGLPSTPSLPELQNIVFTG